jgi:hypothetical protein
MDNINKRDDRIEKLTREFSETFSELLRKKTGGKEKVIIPAL